MAYSEEKADRVRTVLRARPGLTEKEMFGGIAFLLDGNMCVGVHGEDLIVRVEPGDTDAFLRELGAKPFTIGGRGGARGWLLIGPSGHRTDTDLRTWVTRGLAHASSLPKKGGKGGAKKPGPRRKR